MSTNTLKFRIELNVLKHLGIGLYSSTPSILTEMIANAWDADAKKVDIQIDTSAGCIVIDDDGHGMTHGDVQEKFLAVGYSRRTSPSGNFSLGGRRRVMGRKGIGKLAMFSLARMVSIVTKAEGSAAVAFQIDVGELLKSAEASKDVADYAVKSIPVPDDFSKEHGTRITLTELNTKINATEAYLRPRLARRFGVFSDTFRVTLCDSDITRLDAGYYADLQFLWCFDEVTQEKIEPLAINLASYEDEASATTKKCIDSLQAELTADPPGMRVGGFIASVDKPSKLGRGDESLNRLAVFANGRLFQEDVLPELGDARYFNSYLVGEIYADFLDDDDCDRATASRESIRHDDERFLALRNHLRTVFATIRGQWDDWRTAQGYSKSSDKNPEIESWIQGLKDARDRKAADRLMTSIDKLALSNDEAKDAASKKLLYKSAIVGFEKLRARSQLDLLDKVTDVLSPEFQSIFTSLDDIEANYYLEIVRERLAIIEKLEKEIVDQEKLEKVAQKYLFDHLWLLDPSWDRVQGSAEMEVRLSDELRRACPDSDEGARLDIAYRTTSGRHVVIELKRPGLYVKASVLETQGRKYVEALEQWYREHPDACGMNGRLPAIDVYFLVSSAPDLGPRDAGTWSLYGLKMMTYSGLISNARLSYQSYLAINKDVAGRLSTLLDSL